MEPKQILGSFRCRAASSFMQVIFITLLLVIGEVQNAGAQRIWETRKGTIRSQGNLGPGIMFAQKSVSAYLNGEMEIFFEDRFAYTGAICISFVTIPKDREGIRVNDAIFTGANYHFLKPSRWDPYVGITPGVALVRAAYKSGDGIKLTPFSLAPVVGAQFGCNYYVLSFMHFFVKAQVVAGQMFSTLPASKRLDELKIMAGLGWNLRLWKPKKVEVWN